MMKKTYNHLPIRYMRMLHCIIWEQTKTYLSGGIRGLNGLAHPLAPQNTEQIGDEFFKRYEDRWKIGECRQSQKEKDSLKDWLYLVDNDPLEMIRELNRLTGKDIALTICGEEKPGGRVEEGGFGTEEELFHRTDLKRFTDKMRISEAHFRYSRSMRTSKGGVSWLYNWVTAFRAPREQGYELLNEVTQFSLIMTTATRSPDIYAWDGKFAIYNKEEDYVRLYRNLVA